MSSPSVRIDTLTYRLPPDLTSKFAASLEDWQAGGKVRRLWARDASLWTGSDESSWLGWLDVLKESATQLQSLKRWSEEVKSSGIRHLLLLGMGGSSLCPEVLKLTFGSQSGFPELRVLDSTDPAQVRALESKVDLQRSWFIVSSKSGTTLEPNIFKQYFFEKVKKLVGADQVGKRFVAITDPGSKLEEVARRDGFLRVFYGVPSIGGRYSALSNFGLVPAAAIGLDVAQMLQRAQLMIDACAASVQVRENPGTLLGNLLGVLGQNGHDKVTIIASPKIRDFGAWLEQLLAESTGKQGKGLIPVDREELAAPEKYGPDRVFVYLRLQSAADLDQDSRLDALERAGGSVLRISLSEPYDLAQEFFRWEFATAVAGSVLGLNPFDQPDVEANKLETRRLTSEYEQTGALPKESPLYEEGGIQLFADERNASALRASAGRKPRLVDHLRAHLSRLRPGDYLALLAFIEMNEEHEKALSVIRHAVRDRTRAATCLGFGPRFLHSTGQAYKGGPNSGVFLQITCTDAFDLPIPGQKYTFGVVKAAQARGDFQVLAQRGRRALRVHFAKDVREGLAALQSAVLE